MAKSRKKGQSKRKGKSAVKAKAKVTSKTRSGKNKLKNLALDCSIVLPVLTFPLVSTVKLLPKLKIPKRLDKQRKQRKTRGRGTKPKIMEGDEEDELQKPVYLGDLMIGYQSVGNPEPGDNNNTAAAVIKKEEDVEPRRERGAKRKARELLNLSREQDYLLSILDCSVVVKDHTSGKKRKLDLRKLAEEDSDEYQEDQMWKQVKLLKEEEVIGSDLEWSDCEIVEERSPPVLTPQVLEDDDEEEEEKEIDQVDLVQEEEEEEEEVKSLQKELEELEELTDELEGLTEESEMEETEKVEEPTVNPEDVDNVIENIPVTSDNPFVVEAEDYFAKDQPEVYANDTAEESIPEAESILTPNDTATMPLTPESLSPQHIIVSSLGEDDDDTESHSILVLDTAKNPTAFMEHRARQMELITPMDVCNICGRGIQSRKDASTYLELRENNLKYYVCLTCNQRFSLIELARHKANCFLTEEEFGFNHDFGDSSGRNKKEVKLRMVACTSCAEYVQNL